MLSQTDLQSGELGLGWPGTSEQYSAEAQAGPEEEPRQVHKRLGASSAGSVASRTSLATRGPFCSRPSVGRPLPVGGRPLPGERESVRLPFLSLTVFYRPCPPFIPSGPATAGSPLSISCHIFPVLQTIGRRAQRGLLPNRGERLDASLTVLSQALQRGQLGTQSHWAGCGGSHLKRTLNLYTHSG